MILQGRLVRDPETHTTKTGISVSSFTIAWSEKRGETETKLFLPCTAWRGTGEFISKYFKKGQQIIVRGKIASRDWEDREGNKRQNIELTVDEAAFCGSKSDNNSGDSCNTYSSYAATSPVDVDPSELEDDGELPF